MKQLLSNLWDWITGNSKPPVCKDPNITIPKLPKKFPRRKTPLLIQMEAVECGAAALGIILGYYKTWIPLEELRVKCGVSRDGCDAYNLVEAANFYGLDAAGYRLSLEELMSLPPPFIIYWQHNHFMVVEAIRQKKVFVNDPASGPASMSIERFAKGFSQVAITLKKTEKLKPRGKPPELLKALPPRLKPVRKALIFVTIGQLVMIVLGLASPVFSQIFLDNIIGQLMLSWRWWFIFAMGSAMVLTATVQGTMSYVMARLGAKLAIVFSSQFLWHILKLPMHFFTQRFGGEIINRMNLNTRVSATISGELTATLLNVFFVIFYATIMIQFDLIVTAIGITTAILNMLVLIMISYARRNAYARLQQEGAKMSGMTIDSLQSMETIKVTGTESFFFSRMAGYYTKTTNANQAIGSKDVILGSLSQLLSGLSSNALLGIGIWRVMEGNLTIGMLIGLQMLLGRFLSPFQSLVSLGTTIQSLKVDLSRLDDVLENRPDPLLEVGKSEGPAIHTGNTPPTKLKGKVELEGITFGYSPLDDPLISDFSLTIEPGQSAALVGKTGSGKSTVSKVAAGLFEPWTGEVRYDGVPRIQHTRDVLVHSLASVDQEIFLFGGTIKENLTLWNPTIPEEDVIQAAKDACIHNDIIAREGGYDSVLSEAGRNMSGGQRQRLELARALVLNPSILILDEATSALDSQTEAQIVENLKKRGLTYLIIAHRLSTIRDCDEIIVIEKGHAVQRGTHDSLKATPGVYQELITHEWGCNTNDE